MKTLAIQVGTTKTLTIQIGNTDDKLTQREWAEFVSVMKEWIWKYCDEVHFFGASSNWEKWQNAVWVVTCELHRIQILKKVVSETRTRFRQDSAAWTEGETIFI